MHFTDLDDDYGHNISLWNISNTTDLDFGSTSDWCDAGEQEFTIKTFQSCVFVLVFLLGVLGNGLVIAAFVLHRRRNIRSLTDIFLFHLALADLLLLLTLPLQVVDTHLGWIFSDRLCKAARACYAVNTYSGLLLLACISVDRYLVVVRLQEMVPLRRRMLRAGKLAAAGIWFSAALLSLPEILFSGVTGSGADAYCGMLLSGNVKMAANGTVIGVFCASVLVMAACYSLIARTISKGDGAPLGRQKHRRRTLKLMVALVAAFLLFQLPYTVMLSQKMAGQFCGPLLEYVTCTLAYARCCLNPVLYALMGIHFRNDVVKIIKDCGCSCRHAPNSPDSWKSCPMTAGRGSSSCTH